MLATWPIFLPSTKTAKDSFLSRPPWQSGQFIKLKLVPKKIGLVPIIVEENARGSMIILGEDKISGDEKLRLDFEYEKFKNEFNKEMDKSSK